MIMNYDQNEPRARVIRQSPKARVIRPSQPLARVIPSSHISETVVPGDPQEFCDWARQELGVGKNHGFYFEEIAEISGKIGSVPSVYLLDARHWRLVLSSTPQGFRVYDSSSGIEDIGFNSTQRLHITERPRHTFSVHSFVSRRLHTIGYQLPEQHIAHLGRLLYTAADCGPLSVYAAGLALGKISPKT